MLVEYYLLLNSRNFQFLFSALSIFVFFLEGQGYRKRKEAIFEKQSLLICNVDNFMLLNYIYVMLQLFHL